MSYTVYEDLIGLVEVEQTDAVTLAETIRDTLLCSNIQLIQCCGQAYDGTSNMASYSNGVAVHLQKEEPQACYVHCPAHSLTCVYKTVGEVVDVLEMLLICVVTLLILFVPHQNVLHCSAL